MPVRRSAVVALLLSAAVASCGSHDSDSGRSGTHLTVDGVATTSTAFVRPGSHDDVPSTSEPGAATEVSIAGSVTCDGRKSTGTGMFATGAVEICLQIATQAAVFASVGTADDATCAQVYGGPQHASIQGAINGRSVDLTVTRTNGCGIADWTSLEWLLGPPER